MKRASSVLFGAIFVMNIANALGEISYRTIRVDDLDIFYRESGPRDGPTILLLHGLPSSSFGQSCVRTVRRRPDPLQVPAFGLILGQKSVAGSPAGSPTAIDAMLEFSARHSIALITETLPMSKINDAFERMRSGKAHYRIALENDRH